METVIDFIFWGSLITADGDCGYEIKKRLLLGRTDVEAETPILRPPDVKN